MIKNDKELNEHFSSIRKAHWLDFNKYIEKKTKPYVQETSPNLLKSKRKNILDVGPGPGHYTKYLKSIGHNVCGIDRELDSKTMEAYSYLNDKYKLGHLYGGIEEFLDQENFGFDSKFDIINFRGSIWHVIKTMYGKKMDTDELFKRIKESLKSDGIVIAAIDIPSLKSSLVAMDAQKYIKFKKIREGLYIGK